jgi:glycosyltransferase involved in cell wall biosynthesis
MKRLETVVKPACAKAGVELRIAKVPTRVELNRFYNDVDLVLIASEPLYEGNPLSLFESGACGRTVLATNVGCVPEIVEDGVTGFVVESTFDAERTVHAFADRLRWCKDHVAEVRTMGKRHRERVIAERTPEKTCETFRQGLEWAYAHCFK